MPRIQPLSLDTAQGESKAVLESVQQKMGRVPNLLATLAHAPAASATYFGLKEALAKGDFDAKLGEQIALAVGNQNGCDYCVSAHTAIGKGAGLTDEQTHDAQIGKADDPKAQAALTFASAILSREGFVTDEQLADFKAAGYTDAHALEVLAHVVANIFTNYTNHIAETEVDFPAVAIAEAAKV